ncbi:MULTISPECIES: thioesterase II family protein [Xenorhabdus]|uniref:thioesterase II family protein n=1 Tax=Xenorhabdus TaxID=626 RepID=UPI000B3071CA|nr:MULTISPECIES: thioesterase domain-containing protein [Xenorhabdus]
MSVIICTGKYLGLFFILHNGIKAVLLYGVNTLKINEQILPFSINKIIGETIIGVLMNEQNALVFFPYAGGSASSFEILKKHLSEEVRIISMSYSVSEFSVSKNSTDFFSVLLENLKNQLKAFEGKLTFFGHSIGAIIAYELAILGCNHLNIQRLIVSACKPPELLVNSKIFNSEDNAFEKITLLGGLPQMVSSDPIRLKKVKHKVTRDLRVLIYYARMTYPKVNCETHALSARDDFLASENEMKIWSNYTNKGFRKSTFDGNHFYFRDK